MIGAFLSGTTCEPLVHKLGRRGLWTTKELLDIATSHASREEAVGAIFNRSDRKTRRDEDASEGASNHPAKRKNKKQRRDNSLVAAADRKGGQKPTEGTLNHFEKMLEGPCPNHAFPAKHLYKECGLMRKYFARGLNKEEQGKEPIPTTDDTKEKDDTFPTTTGALMIFRGSTTYDSRRR